MSDRLGYTGMNINHTWCHAERIYFVLVQAINKILYLILIVENEIGTKNVLIERNMSYLFLIVINS